MGRPLVRDSTRLFRDLPLRRKILLPFFLIIMLLGATATVGTVILLTDTRLERIDELLTGFSRSVQQQLDRSAQSLAPYATLLWQNSLSGAQNGPETAPPLPITFAGVEYRLHFLPKATFSDVPQLKLRPSLEEAMQQFAPQIALIPGSDGTPLLTIVSPLTEMDAPQPGALLITAPLNDRLLASLHSFEGGRVQIFDSRGLPLLAADDEGERYSLNQEELLLLAAGDSFIRSSSSFFGRRVIFWNPRLKGEPFYFAYDLPMADFRDTLTTFALRTAMTILAAFLFGGLLYSLLIRLTMAPIKALIKGTEAIGRGELDHRIGITGNDELARLATSFDTMMSQLARLYEDRMAQQQRLARATEELQHKKEIERKNEEIASANEELSSHIRELSALLQCNQAMISTIDLATLFDRILSVLKEVLECTDAALFLYDPAQQKLNVQKTIGLELSGLSDLSFSLEDGITGMAARSREPVYVADLKQHPGRLSYKGQTSATGAMVSVPMVIRERLVGMLNLHKTQTAAFAESEIKLAQAIANQAAMAIENAQLYEKTRDLSITDELTGLPNRRHFNTMAKREFDHAKRFSGCFSVVMLDIDHFKKYNDNHGHVAGDTALQQVAEVLRGNTRGVDLVARYGGEEFILLLPETDLAGAVKAAEKIREAIAGRAFAGEQLSQPGGKVTISLGVAAFPHHDDNLARVIELADQALYEAKAGGRNRVAAAG